MDWLELLLISGATMCYGIAFSLLIKSADHKTDPQTCDDCKHNGVKYAYDYACDKCTDMNKFQHEDEPQYEIGMGTLKCDNCSEYGSFKCTKCDGEMYFTRLESKTEPQTERSE